MYQVEWEWEAVASVVCLWPMCVHTPVLPARVCWIVCFHGEIKQMIHSSAPQKTQEASGWLLHFVVSQTPPPPPHSSFPFQATHVTRLPCQRPCAHTQRKLLAATVSEQVLAWHGGAQRPSTDTRSAASFPHTAEWPPAGAQLQLLLAAVINYKASETPADIIQDHSPTSAVPFGVLERSLRLGGPRLEHLLCKVCVAVLDQDDIL